MKIATAKRKAISGIIISLLVLILLFVGISTATYAWYSAINRALGDSITFTSSAYEQVGGDLTIGWRINGGLNELTFDAPNSTLYPMIPKSEAVIGTTTYSDFINNFNYSAQSFNNELHTWIASFSGQNTTPYVCTGSDGGATFDYFYLNNRKTTEKQTVTIRYVINGDLAPYLRIALFMGDTLDTNSNEQNLFGMRLYGILANTDTIHYDQVEENDIISDTPYMNDVHRQSSAITFLMNENSSKCISLVAWLDGVMISNQDIEKDTTFNITFDGIAGDLT